MPNGGVPMHLVLRPRDGSDYVVYCRGNEVHLLPGEVWEHRRSPAEPLMRLSRSEALVLERFLRYWLQDQGSGPIYRDPEVDVEYDF